MIQIAHSATPAATLDTPIAHLSACHRRIEERLCTLERAAPELCARTAEVMAVFQAVFWFFDSNGAHHTADEEESFFPRIVNRISPEEREFLQSLEAEHTRVEAVYDDLKEQVARLSAPPSPAEQAQLASSVEKLCALYRAHIASEEERLPAIASRSLSAAELSAISKEMKQRRGI